MTDEIRCQKANCEKHENWNTSFDPPYIIKDSNKVQKRDKNANNSNCDNKHIFNHAIEFNVSHRWTYYLFSNRLHNLLRRVGHRIAGDDGHAGFGQRLFAGDDVVAFEPDDEREFQAGFLHRRDDAGGDDVAIHDAAENVHEDALHMRIAQNNLERRRDLFLACAAAHVEEIRRIAAEMLDDVHRGHRQARAVDEARDAAVELDVIERKL